MEKQENGGWNAKDGGRKGGAGAKEGVKGVPLEKTECRRNPATALKVSDRTQTRSQSLPRDATLRKESGADANG